MERIVIAGGSGFVGGYLARAFARQGYGVSILTRGPAKIAGGLNFIQWDGRTPGDWVNALEGSRALINLAGKSVYCRFSEANRKAILDSRVASTRVLGSAMARLERPPMHWLNASTCGIYPGTSGRPWKESDTEVGDTFLAQVAREWENAFFESALPQTCRTALRFSLVLGDGGALAVMRRLVRLGLGGKLGNGRQVVSWIQSEDVLKAIQFLLARKLEGPVNMTSPNPVTNRELMRALRDQMHMPVGIPTPEWMMRLGGALIGAEADLVLSSMNAVPGWLLANGFEFRYVSVAGAIKQRPVDSTLRIL